MESTVINRRNCSNLQDVSGQAKKLLNQQNMGNKTALVLATLTVVLNGFIGHFFAPNGIMLTPIVLTITSLLVCLGTKNIKTKTEQFYIYETEKVYTSAYRALLKNFFLGY